MLLCSIFKFISYLYLVDLLIADEQNSEARLFLNHYLILFSFNNNFLISTILFSISFIKFLNPILRSMHKKNDLISCRQPTFTFSKSVISANEAKYSSVTTHVYHHIGCCNMPSMRRHKAIVDKVVTW